MTVDEVESLVRAQLAENLTAFNHGYTPEQAMVPPQEILVIWRNVEKGRLIDKVLTVWLVGHEAAAVDGYRIILQDDGKQFGLASRGFPSDQHLILVGWYGGLVSAFSAM